MVESVTPRVVFAGTGSLGLWASFDGGRVTSDGGLPWLAEADRALGLCDTMAACVPEWRHGPLRVRGRGPRDTYG